MAKSAEQIQFENIKSAVKQLADFCFGSKDHPRFGTCWITLVTSLTAADGIVLNLQPLPKESDELQTLRQRNAELEAKLASLTSVDKPVAYTSTKQLSRVLSKNSGEMWMPFDKEFEQQALDIKSDSRQVALYTKPQAVEQGKEVAWRCKMREEGAWHYTEFKPVEREGFHPILVEPLFKGQEHASIERKDTQRLLSGST